MHDMCSSALWRLSEFSRPMEQMLHLIRKVVVVDSLIMIHMYTTAMIVISDCTCRTFKTSEEKCNCTFCG